MPERDVTSESVVPSSGKSWGIRYSLGAMMVIVALFAGGFGYLAYYRPARCLVNYQVTTLSAQEVEQLGLDFHAINDSPYRWAIDQNDAVSQLVRQRRQVKPPLYEKHLTVSAWPHQADTYTYVRPAAITTGTSPLPEYESGEFAGFWGVRKAGEQLMFRVQAQLAHRQPRQSDTKNKQAERFDEVVGSVAYDGEFPKANLVFAAPINDQHVHLIFIEVKEASLSDPPVYQPGLLEPPINQPKESTKQQEPPPEALDNTE